MVIAGVAACLTVAALEPENVDRSWADRLQYVGVAVDEPGYHVWGSSPVVGPEGKTHLFVSRWPVSAKFVPGWYAACTIAHYVGENPEGPFTFRDVVLEGTGQTTWDRFAPHNPNIQKIGSWYALLYIANSGQPFPVSQRIGMAISKSLNGPWQKVGRSGLVLSPPEDPSIWSYQSRVGVNNPALLQHPDGRFFLYYKARREGDVPRMGVAIAEKLEGPYVHAKHPLTGNQSTVEDGYAFVENGKIHLLTTDNERGTGLLWSSADGIRFSDPILGFDPMKAYIPGTSLQAAPDYYAPHVQKFERPQVLVQNGQATHLYVAAGVNINAGDGACAYVLRIRKTPAKATGQDPLVRQREHQQPNILFFFVDDMGWQDTSVPFHSETTQLNRDYRTPNLEKLARRGLRFTSAYACSICSPSRVSLMTGQNAARHGVTCWTLRKDTSPEAKNGDLESAPWRLNGLQPIGSGVPRSVEATTLPQILREHGYRTIHAGKGHFGAKDTPGADPRNLGFDVNIAGSYMGGPGSYHGDKNFSAEWRGGDRIWDIPGLEKYHGQQINLTEAITREAIAAIEQAVTDHRPFYLYLSHYAVHAPWEADRRFYPNYADLPWAEHKKIYASMLESMDRSLGDLMVSIDRLAIAENTIIVFMSDNGSPKQNPQNVPLRGHKISAYEGGTRVPLVVHWPGRSPANHGTDRPVIIEDIFPTFLEMAGIQEFPESDGVSFVELIENPGADRSSRPLFWHYPNLYDMPPHSAVRLGDLKLIYWHQDRNIQLFDLRQDIGEKHDLAADRRDDVKRLAKLLSDHLRETKAQMLFDKSTGHPVPLPDLVI